MSLLVYLGIGIVIAVVDGGWLSRGEHSDLEEAFAVTLFWPGYLASILLIFCFAALVQAMIWLMKGT